VLHRKNQVVEVVAHAFGVGDRVFIFSADGRPVSVEGVPNERSLAILCSRCLGEKGEQKNRNGTREKEKSRRCVSGNAIHGLSER
jgi:hypothetical protein